MANKEQKLIPTRHEETVTQNKVTMMKNNKQKIGNGNSSEGLSNSLPHLSHDIIIYGILTRVPIDSLMRFRCVCKSWSKLIISDSEFTNLWRTYNSSSGLIWISENYAENDDDLDREAGLVKSNVIVFYDIDKKEKKVFQFKLESGLVNKRLRIRDSLNGLILLSCREDEFETHHVYNPITGYSMKLPNLEYTAPQRNIYNVQLAYDPNMGKFKVLCLCFGDHEQRDNYFFKIVTLGVESETWRDLVVPKSYPRLHDDYLPMFSRGSLYWLTHHRNEGNSSDNQRNILAFDVSKETFYTIMYPKGAFNDCKLLEMDGSLCFLDYVSTGKLRLWVLKEDKEKQNNQHREYEWVEKYNVDNMPSLSGLEPPSVGYDSDNCYAIVTNPTVKIIFWTYCGHEEAHVSSYDLQLRRMDSIFEMQTMSYQWHLNCLANF